MISSNLSEYVHLGVLRSPLSWLLLLLGSLAAVRYTVKAPLQSLKPSWSILIVFSPST